MEYIRNENYIRNIPDECKTYDFYIGIIQKKMINNFYLIPKKFRDYNLYKKCFENENSRVSLRSLANVPDKFKDREMCVCALSSYYDYFEYVPEELLNYDFYLEIVSKNWNNIVNIPKKLKKDDKIIRGAINSIKDGKEKQIQQHLINYIPNKKRRYKLYYYDISYTFNNFNKIPKKFLTLNVFIRILTKKTINNNVKFNLIPKKIIIFKYKNIFFKYINFEKMHNFNKSLSYYYF
jgi:hypothetical protein